MSNSIPYLQVPSGFLVFSLQIVLFILMLEHKNTSNFYVKESSSR